MRYHVLCSLLAVACTLTGGAAQTNAVQAPFHVVTSSGTMVRVDLGARRDRATSLRRATVLTRSGAVRAELVRTERVCEVLCPDDEQEEECHFEAILRASAPVDTAVAVLAGSPDVRNIVGVSIGAERVIDNPAPWLEAEPFKSNDATYRWTRFPDGVFLTMEDYGRDFYAPPIDLADCALRPVAPFTIVSCPTAELLYEGSRGIAFSVADYGDDTVDPLIRFRLNGRDAAVIQLGLKAAVATALLVRGDDGLWRLSVRPFDYARLC